MKTSVQWLLTMLCCVLLISGTTFSQGAGKKTTVAVLEFQSGGSLEKQEASTLTNRFRALLVKTQAFQLIERDKMNDILKEQDFIISDNCNTSECVVQVGQLLGVEKMIAGDIGKLGETYTIDLRMIDVSSGEVIQSLSRDHTGKIDGLLNVMQTIVSELTETVSGRTTVIKYNLSIAASLPFFDSSQKIDIFVNGAKIGQNSAQVSLSAGVHKILVTANDSNYTEFRKDIDLKEDQKLNIKLDYSEVYHQRKAALANKQKEEREKAEKEKAEKDRMEREKKLAEKSEKKKSTETGAPTSKGPSYALLSVAVPGLGGYFVEKNKIRPAAATIGCLGLIGYGLMQKSKSNDYYSDYKKDRSSSSYNKANSAHHAYYIATRVGAAIWIADIIYVAFKGAQNQKQSGSASQNGFRMNYCDNQLQVGYAVNF